MSSEPKRAKYDKGYWERIKADPQRHQNRKDYVKAWKEKQKAKGLGTRPTDPISKAIRNKKECKKRRLAKNIFYDASDKTFNFPQASFNVKLD